MDGKKLIEALTLVEKEKGIDKEIIFEAIEASLITACKKNYETNQKDIKVDINRETGDVKVYIQKKVVEKLSEEPVKAAVVEEVEAEEIENSEDAEAKPVETFLEITLEEARQIDKKYKVGDIVNIEITPKNFNRISAQTAKQVVVQKFREAEREKIYNEYISKEKDIVTAIVQRTDQKGNVIVSLGKSDAFLAHKEQLPNEKYDFNDRIKVYVLEVKNDTKGPRISVSRTHYELVKRLFEQEVPEINDGTVEIMNVSREAGSRTKMAVRTQNENVDAVGSCVGPNGARVAAIVNELKGEKIDIVPWSENARDYIAAALSPSNVIAVEVSEDEDEKSARVVVPDNQLSLAIGKEGQNVRLAARLTGRKIDIKSESVAREMGNEFVDFDNPLNIIGKKKCSAEQEA